MDNSTAKKMEQMASAAMTDIQSDPTKYGAPTFEEFKRNPEAWLGKHDQVFATIDKGSSLLKNVLESRYKFEIEGFKCNTLVEVERIAKDHGISIRDLDYKPELIPQGGGKAQMLIKFVSKNDREKRSQW